MSLKGDVETEYLKSGPTNDAEPKVPEVVVPLLRIGLNPGYTLLNIYTFFFASFANVCALVFLNGSLPYLLTNFLFIPQSEQGNYTGNVLLCNEIAVIASITVWGILSDKIGRKVIYVLSFIMMGASIMVHPLTTNFTQLILARVLFALGASASVSMLTAILADYPVFEAKGRAGGVVGLLAGCGALLALFVFLRIPQWAKWGLQGGGYTMYWCVGGFFLLVAVILAVGLSDEINTAHHTHETLWTIIKEGTLAAKNPRIALSYLASFAARGDAIIITSFLSLWVNKWESQNGGSPADALAAAGVITGVAQTMALVGAPFFGLASDYVDRTLCQVIAAFVACAGYLWMFFLDNPTAVIARIAIAVVGIGEIGMIVVSQILVASEAPPNVRGAVSGFFGLAGSISILISTKLGGWIFDNWIESGPFLLVGLYNGIVLVFGILILLKARYYDNDIVYV